MASPIESVVGLLIVVAAPLAVVFYTRLALRLKQEGGSVKTGWVGDFDILMTLVLSGALAGLAIKGLQRPEDAAPALKPEQVVPGMIFLGVLAGGVALFLLVRRVSLPSVIGLGNLPLPRVIGRALLLLLIGLPAILILSYATALFLGEQAKPQELVTLFTDVIQKGDTRTLLSILFAGTVVAPICEEFLFRGYFYSVAKRYLGAVPAALVFAFLFALSHTNLASLPGLMALALCFTVAFEWSGSLLVPMCMHALFNGANLLLLFLVAKAGH